MNKRVPVPKKQLSRNQIVGKEGQKFLIEAVANIERKSPGTVVLDIYGGDYGGAKYGEYLNSLIKSFNAESFIHIHDFIPQDQLSQVYLSSDIFVLSSLHEGCPNVLLEAMAHGLVSLSTRVSGASTILDRESGVLVDTGSVEALEKGLEELISRKENFPEMGDAARSKMLKDFGTTAHINKLEQILF
jgi:glycosyltransferase involved in cell wall biosynthesis